MARGPSRASVAIKKWREGAGLSQTAAAELVGVTQPTWSDWEAGLKCPHVQQAIAIQKKTGVLVELWNRAA